VDTLEISDSCFAKRLIVKSSLDTTKYTAFSNCNAFISGKSVFLNKHNRIRVEYNDLNKLIITFDVLEHEKKIIQIFNLLGSVIFHYESYESSLELDFDHLSQGFYILRIDCLGAPFISIPFYK